MMKIIGNIFDRFTQAMDASLLDIRSVGCDLLILAVFLAVICTGLGCLIGRIVKKRILQGIFLVLGTGSSVCVEYVMRNLDSCVLRVRKILDNVEFILSYENNIKPFLASLGLTYEYAPKVRDVVYYMNEAEWKKVEKGTGYMSWYMKGIHKSLDKTVRMFGYHLGRTGYEQGGHCIIIVLLLGLFFTIVLYKTWLCFFKGKTIKTLASVFIFISCAVLCEILCFGTILYFTASLAVLLLFLLSCRSIKGGFCY